MAEKAKECTVCLETFVDPKLLPCRHSYCKQCIHSLAKGSTLECPLCKTSCNVDQIVHDFQTENFVVAFKELEEEFNQRLVAATAAFSPEHSAPSENIDNESRKCDLCNENKIAFWCVDCKQWICVPCKKIHQKITATKDHHIEELKVKNNRIESLLQNEIEGLKVKINDFHRFIKKLQGEKKNTKDIQLKTLQESKETRAHCILEMNDLFDRIDQAILKGTDGFSSLLEREISQHREHVFALETKLDSFVAKKKDPNLAIEGETVVQQAKHVVTTTKSPDIYISSIAIKLKRLQAWSANAVDLEIDGGSIRQKDELPFGNSSLKSVASRRWTRHQSVSVPNNPRCLRIIGNNLYQCNDDGITVYDTRLNQLNNIPSCDMGEVYDVCDMSNGNLVVASRNGLFHTKTNGVCVTKILKGLFTGVVRHQNRYYAADTNTRTIHVYEHADDWNHCYSFSVKAANWYTLTLGIHNELLYVGLTGDHRIDIFSLSGHLQSSTGCKGSGGPDHLNCPFICSTDSAGAALIADYCNDRLQLLNAHGQWNIVQLDPPVERPYGACLISDKLYVNEFSMKLIHAYKME